MFQYFDSQRFRNQDCDHKPPGCSCPVLPTAEMKKPSCLAWKTEMIPYAWIVISRVLKKGGQERSEACELCICVRCLSLPGKGLHQQQLWGALHAMADMHWKGEICICGFISWATMLLPLTLPSSPALSFFVSLRFADLEELSVRRTGALRTA